MWEPVTENFTTRSMPIVEVWDIPCIDNVLKFPGIISALSKAFLTASEILKSFRERVKSEHLEFCFNGFNNFLFWERLADITEILRVVVICFVGRVNAMVLKAFIVPVSIGDVLCCVVKNEEFF